MTLRRRAAAVVERRATVLGEWTQALQRHEDCLWPVLDHMSCCGSPPAYLWAGGSIGGCQLQLKPVSLGGRDDAHQMSKVRAIDDRDDIDIPDGHIGGAMIGRSSALVEHRCGSVAAVAAAEDAPAR